MKPPTSGWPKRAYESMLAKDKPNLEYALMCYMIRRGEPATIQLFSNLLKLMPEDVRAWWSEEDASLPPVEEAGEQLFQRLMLEVIAVQRRN